MPVPRLLRTLKGEELQPVSPAGRLYSKCVLRPPAAVLEESGSHC